MRGAFAEFETLGLPDDAITGIMDGVDFNVYFFENNVSVSAMYTILVGSVILFTGLFVLFHKLKKRA